jgi:hypothetical protein
MGELSPASDEREGPRDLSRLEVSVPQVIVDTRQSAAGQAYFLGFDSFHAAGLPLFSVGKTLPGPMPWA